MSDVKRTTDEERPVEELWKKPVTKDELKVGWIMVAFFLSCITATTFLQYQEKEDVNQLLKSEMMKLAEQGKPRAIRWAEERHYISFESRNAGFKALAEAGDVDAMYAHGLMLEEAGDVDGAYGWYAKAAAEGQPGALEKTLTRKEGSNVQ